MRKIVYFILLTSSLFGCSEKKHYNKTDFIIARGQMPNLVKDKDNNIHLVYGSGDSIMYSYSSDNGNSFSSPLVISVLPGAYSFATRGPQIAATNNGIVVTASTSKGDIYSFFKENKGNWLPGSKVNDLDTTAKEGLMALSADEDAIYAVWLDLRGNKHNKIYGARSNDNGKTWSRNIMVYASPDGTVCECCKPSVVVKGSNVYVMFRNWLKGSRDLYLVQSADGGNTYKPAQKLGNGDWKINGCPMDGGGLALNKDGLIQTVWRRKGGIFSSMPGMPEKGIGEGQGCTVETINNENVYAWTNKGEVILVKSGQKEIIGKGSQPVIKAINNSQVICVWEDEKQIHAAVVNL